MSFQLWSTTAANNDDADIDAGVELREGQGSGTFNDTMRAVMAELKKWGLDISGNIDDSGAADAYVVTSNQTLTTYTGMDGFCVAFRATNTNTGASTLNVDAQGAKDLEMVNGTALNAGDIVAGRVYMAYYDETNDTFIMFSSGAARNEFPSGTVMLFSQTAAPTGWTKDTSNYNDHALRVVTGTASNGGTVAFETAFASQTPAGTIGATTLTLSQIPLHGHPFRTTASGENTSDNQGGILLGDDSARTNRAAFTGTPSDTVGEQIGGAGGGGSHDHTFSGTAINLDVQYVDVIRATKD